MDGLIFVLRVGTLFKSNENIKFMDGGTCAYMPKKDVMDRKDCHTY